MVQGSQANFFKTATLFGDPTYSRKNTRAINSFAVADRIKVVIATNKGFIPQDEPSASAAIYFLDNISGPIFPVTNCGPAEAGSDRS